MPQSHYQMVKNEPLSNFLSSAIIGFLPCPKVPGPLIRVGSARFLEISF